MFWLKSKLNYNTYLKKLHEYSDILIINLFKYTYIKYKYI